MSEYSRDKHFEHITGVLQSLQHLKTSYAIVVLEDVMVALTFGLSLGLTVPDILKQHQIVSTELLGGEQKH